MTYQTSPSTVSIGLHREDGDFQVLATLNNNDGLIGHGEMNDLIEAIRFRLAAITSTPAEQIVAIERQDAPDYVDLGA